MLCATDLDKTLFDDNAANLKQANCKFMCSRVGQSFVLCYVQQSWTKLCLIRMQQTLMQQTWSKLWWECSKLEAVCKFMCSRVGQSFGWCYVQQSWTKLCLIKRQQTLLRMQQTWRKANCKFICNRVGQSFAWCYVRQSWTKLHLMRMQQTLMRMQQTWSRLIVSLCAAELDKALFDVRCNRLGQTFVWW